MHLLGGVGLGKELSEVISVDGDFVQLTLFLLGHHGIHRHAVTAAVLTELLQTLCLRKRGCGLPILHSVQQVCLLLGSKERQFHSRVERYLFVIHHLHEFRYQVCEVYIPLNLPRTFAGLLSNNLAGFLAQKIPVKLAGIFFRRSSSSSSHGVHLHLVGTGTLAGQHGFPLKITVHHRNNGGIIIHLANQHRHTFQSQKLGSMKTPMSGNDFITAFRSGTSDCRGQDSELRDALYRALHGFIIQHSERMIFEWE